MKKIKIFTGIRDNAFSEKLKELSEDVEIKEWPGPQPNGLPPVLQQKLCQKNTMLQDCSTTGAELLFLDRIPSNGFYGVKIKSIIVASKYSKRKEYLAASSGAKAFLTKDITKPNLLRAIKSVSNGEIWMTRAAIARVFEEYTRLLRKDIRIEEGIKLPAPQHDSFPHMSQMRQ